MRSTYPLLLGLLLAMAPQFTPAAVTLPPLLSDHAVLQKSPRTALWGKADPGEKVTATLAGVRGEATADPNGAWRIELDLSQVGPGPFELIVEGSNRLAVADVDVGEVWVASGQSNMAFALNHVIGAPEEIASSGNPQIRQFMVTQNASAAPQEECAGSWIVADPNTTWKFTAVGYYFAQNLQQKLGVPVGVIHSSWGGTPIESWTSAEALDTNPDLQAARARISKDVSEYPRRKAEFAAAFQQWAKEYDRADRSFDPASFTGPAPAPGDWKPVTLPGSFKAAGLPDTGAIWIRKSFTLHGDLASGKTAVPILLGNLEGFETVYYNGKKVGEITPDTYEGPGSPHNYFAKNSVEGENVLAIRIYNPLGNAGLGGDLGGRPDPAYTATPMRGEWLAQAEYALPPADQKARAAYPQAPKAMPAPQIQPATLYNGMIAPLLSYTIKGAIWYQGENNVSRAFQYQTAFPLMISDWRARWGSDFPFYFCQLAGFLEKAPAPVDSPWAELREAQGKTLSLPNTGEAVLFDLGESGDIHPRRKKEVGERLALLALNKTYGQPLPCSGPVLSSQKIEGNTIRLSFQELAGGLVAKPLPDNYMVSSLANKTAPLTRHAPEGELEGFAICGEDRKWAWATARIDGDVVVVSSPSVPAPIAVRYAWAENPTGNLYNQADLPASPFRTDTFPLVTEKAKF